MRESEYYRKLSKKLNNDVPIFLKRIENKVNLGTPDFFFRSMYGGGWAEMKVIKFKARSNIVNIDFEPGQFAWLHEYCEMGGNANLVCFRNDHIYIFKNRNIKTNYTVGFLDEYFSFIGTFRKFDEKRFVQVLSRGK